VKHRHRSAVTGRFVTAAYAKRYPKRTVREAIPSRKLQDFCKGRRG
jgi:hypothetical protein